VRVAGGSRCAGCVVPYRLVVCTEAGCHSDLKPTNWDPSSSCNLGAHIKEREMGRVCSAHETIEMYADHSFAKDDVEVPIRRFCSGWKNNVRMSAKVTGLECVD
jgi:hypothetical protein